MCSEAAASSGCYFAFKRRSDMQTSQYDAVDELVIPQKQQPACSPRNRSDRVNHYGSQTRALVTGENDGRGASAMTSFGFAKFQPPPPPASVINNSLAAFCVPLEESFEPFPWVMVESMKPDGSFFHGYRF